MGTSARSRRISLDHFRFFSVAVSLPEADVLSLEETPLRGRAEVPILRFTSAHPSRS